MRIFSRTDRRTKGGNPFSIYIKITTKEELNQGNFRGSRKASFFVQEIRR
nr:MAG TPA: hypothetical protein [Caudoviricetes sp.]